MKILFVHGQMIDALLGKFADAIANRTVDRPWDEGITITPILEAIKAQSLLDSVEEAASQEASDAPQTFYRNRPGQKFDFFVYRFSFPNNLNRYVHRKDDS